MKTTMIERTILSKPNIVVVGCGVVVLVCLVTANLIKYFNGDSSSPFEAGAYLIILVALVERAQGKYEYEADQYKLSIRKKGLLSHETFDIPYQNIFGIYRYKAKLVGYMKFRRTLRLHSALDGRTVWTIAYKKKENSKDVTERAYFKPSEDMLNFLAAMMPDRVMVPENKVVIESLAREKQY